ncbi:hypothetical protein ACTJI8_02905 [Microbacterium sp. 22303]|uniref:hypothetical protein n=1 Tax=Microbacterium sp. 22303 TaxID=3453905 RepID=UPI003F86D264
MAVLYIAGAQLHVDSATAVRLVEQSELTAPGGVLCIEGTGADQGLYIRVPYGTAFVVDRR